MQEPPVSSSQPNQLQPGVIVAAVGIVLAVGAIAYGTVVKKTDTTTSASPAPATQTSVDTSSPSSEGTYKDGTYSVIGNYISPGGDEELGVTVTLENNIITEAEVEPKAFRPMSQNFQGIFKDNFKQYVIGKNINDVKLDKVSGSSLSPKGFNDALEKVKVEAQV